MSNIEERCKALSDRVNGIVSAAKEVTWMVYDADYLTNGPVTQFRVYVQAPRVLGRECAIFYSDKSMENAFAQANAAVDEAFAEYQHLA